MHLDGSCHCGAVRFSLESDTPVPYMRCYCSICRKTGGGGGFAINLGGQADSLKVQGEEAISVYNAVIEGKPSPAERRFCSRCGAALWAWDPRWPDLVHPFASAIDTALPPAPQNIHIMLASKPAWVPLHDAKAEDCYEQYPTESLHDWHHRLGLLEPS